MVTNFYAKVNDIDKHFIKKQIYKFQYCFNFFKYGNIAPRYAELIWVDPRKINKTCYCSSKLEFLKLCGINSNIKNDFIFSNLYDSYKIRSCYDHWTNRVPWKNTEAYVRTLSEIKVNGICDGCYTEKDLQERYNQLDEIFLEIKSDMRLKTRKELDSNAFREEGGILICIGANGEPIFGLKGHHRLAIALILNLPIIPGQLGWVSENAIKSLSKYRDFSS